MRYLLRSIFGVGKKKETLKRSPVYAFFAEAGNSEKKSVYKKAISQAEKEQKDLIAQYEREVAGTTVS